MKVRKVITIFDNKEGNHITGYIGVQKGEGEGYKGDRPSPNNAGVHSDC